MTFYGHKFGKKCHIRTPPEMPIYNVSVYYTCADAESFVNQPATGTTLAKVSFWVDAGAEPRQKFATHLPVC